jgi:tetratricopeptide (TPR) repeat protein
MMSAHFIDDHRVAIAMGYNLDRPSVRFDSNPIRIWNVVDKKIERTIECHSDWLTCMDMDLSRSRVLTGSRDRTVQLLDVDSGETIRKWGPVSSELKQVAFANKDRYVIALEANGWLHAWSTETAELVFKHEFKEPNIPELIAGFGQSNHVLLAWTTGEVEIFQVDKHFNAESVTQFSTNAEIRSLALSPDDAFLAIGLSSGNLALCDVSETDKTVGLAEPVIIPAHTLPIEAVEFSSDGNRLFSASTDTSIRVWDLSSRQQVMTLEGPTNSLCRLAISPDFNHILMTNRTILGQWRRYEDSSYDAAQLQSVDQRIKWHEAQFARAISNRRYGAALFHDDALSSLNKDHVSPHAQRAELFANLGRWSETARELAAIPVDQRLQDHWLQIALLGLYLDVPEQYQQACAALCKGLSEDTTPDQINNLTWPIAYSNNNGVDFAQIKPAVERMLGAGRTADRLNTAGAVLYRAGELEIAKSYLEESLSQRKDLMAAFDHLFLSMIARDQGIKEQAQFHWTIADRIIEKQRNLVRAERPPHPVFVWSIRLELEILAREAQPK